MIRIHKKGGFASLVEVIITGVIFALAAIVMLTVFSMLEPHKVESRNKLAAAYLAQNVLDDLHLNVDARTWMDAASPLAPGITHTRIYEDYTVNYRLQDVGSLGVRKLTMNVYYPED